MMSAQLRTFYFYRPDGSLCGSTSCSDHPGFEERVRRQASEKGEGVIEHDGELDLFHDRVDVASGKLIDPIDYAFAADLEAKWQRILSLFPMLANPVPPAPVPRAADGQQHRFNCAEFWAEFAERAAWGEWTLRAPSNDFERLAGPFRGHGACLDPVFREGVIHYYDPLLPAQDGDIVLVKLDALELQRIFERNRHKPEWMAMYGVPNPVCTKLLKAFGREYWLVTNDSMFELGKNKILGVLRYTLRNGEPAYMVPNIGPNAATTILTARDDGPDSFNPAAGGDGYLSVSGSGLDAAGVLNGSLTIDAQQADVVTLSGIALQVTWSGGSESTATAQPVHTERRAYSFQHSFTTLPANTNWTMRVAMSGNANITVNRASLRAEVIKR